MPIYTSLQHSMYCENHETCNQFEDFMDITARYMTSQKTPTPHQYYRNLGYRKIGGKWYCKECAKKLKQSPPHQ